MSCKFITVNVTKLNYIKNKNKMKNYELLHSDRDSISARVSQFLDEGTEAIVKSPHLPAKPEMWEFNETKISIISQAVC